MLEIFFQIEDFRMPPTAEPEVGYILIRNELEIVDQLLNNMIEDN